jgi:hypothetical protein
LTGNELSQRLNAIVLEAIKHLPAEQVAQILRGLADFIEMVAARPED